MIEAAKEILKLPGLAYAPRNLPKSFFERNFSLTASERKFLAIPFLPLKATWLAELNFKTVNVPVFQNEQYTYTRIPIFVVEISAEHWINHLDELCRLYHKYIPFQVLLFVHAKEQYCVSAATKIINQKESDKRVVEETYRTPEISLLMKDTSEEQFRERLTFQHLDRINLKTVYDSYIAAIVNYKRAVKTGDFEVRKEVGLVNQNLNELERIERECVVLKNKLHKTKDVREKVELQMQLQALRARKTQLEDTL